MQNAIELKKLFDKLDVNLNNRKLFENLLDLDRSVFKPLIEKILTGDLDIEDTRPIFSIFLSKPIGENQLASKMFLIDTPSKLLKNVSDRLFNPESFIKEADISNIDQIEETKIQVINSYQQSSGVILTDGEKKALVVAIDAYVKNDITTISKNKQRRFSDKISPGPI